MFRLLITGSRKWVDVDAIRAEFELVKANAGSEVLLVSGACPRGADRQCELLAREFGWKIELHPLNWKSGPEGAYNPMAGFERNELMVNLGADFVLAFIMDNSGGAMNTVRHANKAGIPVKEIHRSSEVTAPKAPIADWLKPYVHQAPKAELVKVEPEVKGKTPKWHRLFA